MCSIKGGFKILNRCGHSCDASVPVAKHGSLTCRVAQILTCAVLVWVRPVDGAALLAAAEQGRLPGAAAAAELMAPVHDKKHERKDKSKGKSKHKDKDKAKSKDKKRRSADRDKPKVDESKLRLTAAQLEASVQAMRKERTAREEQERLREKQLLRIAFRP